MLMLMALMALMALGFAMSASQIKIKRTKVFARQSPKHIKIKMNKKKMNKEIANIVTMPNTKNKTEYATTIPVPRSLLRTEVMANKTGENKVKNLPIMFAKKIKAVRLVKPLNHITNDSGKTRHFTPAAQE